MMDNIAVCLSGGIDSATVLAMALRWPTHKRVAISFRYGSKHNKLELIAASKIAGYYGVEHRIINAEHLFEGIESSLINSDTPIPEGHYTDVNMSTTVVPMRNVVFASLAAAFAINHFNDGRSIRLGLGVHQGDHAIYPDCRPHTIMGMADCFSGASDEQVNVFAPLLMDNKTQIIEIGLNLAVPYELTRTCYQETELACGVCGACHERQEAFVQNGVMDPINYEVQ